MPVYLILFVIGTGRCFRRAGGECAGIPSLVPKEHFVNAVTWGATVFQIANASGPMFGGLLFTLALTGRLAELNGAPLVYCFTLICLFSCFWC